MVKTSDSVDFLGGCSRSCQTVALTHQHVVDPPPLKREKKKEDDTLRQIYVFIRRTGLICDVSSVECSTNELIDFYFNLPGSEDGKIILKYLFSISQRCLI